YCKVRRPATLGGSEIQSKRRNESADYAFQNCFHHQRGRRLIGAAKPHRQKRLCYLKITLLCTHQLALERGLFSMKVVLFEELQMLVGLKERPFTPRRLSRQQACS